MSESFNIGQFRQKEAERFAKYMEQQENEKKLVEDKIIIENETILLKEMEIREDFDMFLSKLDITSSEIINVNNILDIDLHVVCFMNILENGKQFLDNLNFIQEITNKVMVLINNVTNNTNSKFNVMLKNENTEAANRISNHIKLCLRLVNYDDASIDIELMDTQEDEEMATKLQFECYGNDNNEFTDLAEFSYHVNDFDDNLETNYNDNDGDLAEFSYDTDKSDY